MPVQDLIEVRAFVDGKEAIEYEEPDDVDENYRCVRYIETTPGQQLEIYVKWLAGFRILEANGLCCQVQKEDETRADRKRLPIKILNHCRGTLTEPAGLDFTNSLFKDPETGRRTVCEWVFEGVELTNDLRESDSLEFSRMQSIGSVSIAVYRVKKVKLEEPLASRVNYTIPSPTTKLPEYMFKGKDIKQTIKHINRRPFLGSVSNMLVEYKFIPMDGLAGERFLFIFKHRDRKALQKLGCIPRNPTPPPEHSLLVEQLQRTVELKKRKDREKDRKIAALEAENRVTKREVAALAHQMALLLSNRTAEVAESPDNNEIFTPTTSSSETNDTEAIRDLQEITNPKPKPKPEDVIDLTGDSD